MRKTRVCNEDTNVANVHRFGDRVAVSVGNGSTTYLSAKQARKLAKALNGCARSVSTEKYVDSHFGVVEIKWEDLNS